MSNIVFFVDTKYSNYFVASRAIKQYAIDHIADHSTINSTFVGDIIFVKSNLIGLTNGIIDDFVSKKAKQEALVGVLNAEICMIRINTDILNASPPYLDIFDNAANSNWPSYDLNLYNLKLLNNIASIMLFEQEVQNKLRKNAIEREVLLQDPVTTYLAFDTQFGNNVLIEPNVYFASGVKIHDDVHIRAFSYLENAEIAQGAHIGPFARIRGNSKIGKHARIGNFVEIKNSILDSVKVSHLSYIGDAVVGKNVNIGAGVITCNYDGFEKHTTIIKEDTFIGSNSTLIAPITIGSNSLIGAASFINRDVPDKTFAIGRSTQSMKPNRRNK